MELLVINHIRFKFHLMTSKVAPDGANTGSTKLKGSKKMTLKNFSELADVFKEGGQLFVAEDLYRTGNLKNPYESKILMIIFTIVGIAGHQKVVGIHHPQTLALQHSLALVLEAQRKFSDAEEVYLATLKDRELVLGNLDVSTCSTAFCYAEMLRKCGRKKDAVEYYTYALKGFTEKLGKKHKNTKLTKRHLKSLGKDIEKQNEIDRYIPKIPPVDEWRCGDRKCIIS